MKRLVRKAFGKILYHGTTLDSFKNIVSSGMIMPQESNGAGMQYDEFYDENPEIAERNFDGFVFLTTKDYIARDYAIGSSGNYASAGGVGVVIEIDVPESSLLPDDSDMPEARTWQESSVAFGQVKVLGPITTDYFRDIHFYNSKLQLRIFVAQLNNWEQKFEENKNLLYAQSYNEEDVKKFLNKAGGKI